MAIYLVQQGVCGNGIGDGKVDTRFRNGVRCSFVPGSGVSMGKRKGIIRDSRSGEA